MYLIAVELKAKVKQRLSHGSCRQKKIIYSLIHSENYFRVILPVRVQHDQPVHHHFWGSKRELLFLESSQCDSEQMISLTKALMQKNRITSSLRDTSLWSQRVWKKQHEWKITTTKDTSETISETISWTQLKAAQSFSGGPVWNNKDNQRQLQESLLTAGVINCHFWVELAVVSILKEDLSFQACWRSQKANK